MTMQHTYTTGDRVRVVCACPGAGAGDEGRVVSVHGAGSDSIESLTVLIDSDPATIHGITVMVHEVELVMRADPTT